MPEVRVVNASPLIVLVKSGLLDLLADDARVVVPRSVADEVRRYGSGDHATRALVGDGRLNVVDDVPIIADRDPGTGESANPRASRSSTTAPPGDSPRPSASRFAGASVSSFRPDVAV